MDKDFLKALNNLSDALNLIAETLKKKKIEEDQPSIMATISKGDISESIKKIEKSIRELQVDNKKILENQETLINLYKEKEKNNKLKPFLLAGDKNTQKLIKSGVSIIMIIAAGVLSIGTAFKIIGKVDFMSVMSLSTAIYLISLGFSKISETKLTISDALTISSILTITSLSLTLSSYILSEVKQIDNSKFSTIIMLGLLFSGLTYFMSFISKNKNLINSGIIQPDKLLFFITSISAALVASSHILQYIKPLSQNLIGSIILIGTALSISSILMGEAMKITGKFKVEELTKGTVSLILISTAIVVSSHILSNINTNVFEYMGDILKYSVVLTIATTLVGLSMKFVLSKIKEKDLVMGLIGLISISAAIAASSVILSVGDYTTYPSIQWALGTTVTMILFAGLLTVFGGIMSATGGAGFAVLGLGLLTMITLAASISAISLTLAAGNYSYGGELLTWSKAVSSLYMSFSLLLISTSITGIFSLFNKKSTNIKDTITDIADAIKDISIKLSEGVYGYASQLLPWSKAVVGLYNSFGVLMFILSTVSFESDVFKTFMKDTSEAIRDSSILLAAGNYKNGPNETWANGVYKSMTAFSNIYFELKKRESGWLFGILKSGNVSVEDFKNAIETISLGITTAADYFSRVGAGWNNGPPIEWAIGVGKSITAFSDVYFRLHDSGFLTKVFNLNKMSVDDFKNAIITITQGIIASANAFSETNSKWANYPPIEWAIGVGKSITAFSDVYFKLKDKEGIFQAMPEDFYFTNFIKNVSSAIISAGDEFSKVDPNAWSIYPSIDWATSMGSLLKEFLIVYEEIDKKDIGYNQFNKMSKIIKDVIVGDMTYLAENMKKFNESLSGVQINPNIISSISKNIYDYVNLLNFIKESDIKPGVGGIVGKIKGVLFGKESTMSPIDLVTSGMLKLGDAYIKLAESFSKFNTSLNKVDVEKLSTIKSLLSNIILLSVMDSDEFQKMMDALDKKAGIFKNLVADLGDANNINNLNSVKINKNNNETDITSKEQKTMIRLLKSIDGKLSILLNNSNMIADYANEIITKDDTNLFK